MIEIASPSGELTRQPLPAGAGVMRIAIDGQRDRVMVVDAGAPRRVLVEFDAPPRLAPAAGGRIGPTSAMRARDLRGDLARLASSAMRAPGPAPVAQITREYQEVFSGAAVTIAPELLDALRRLPYVKRVVRDDTVHVDLAQSVPLIRADVLRQMTGATGAGIRVGIIDTGIDYNHPAFGGGFGPGHRVAGGYDFFNMDDDPMDDHGHGTHVAGIVGGNGGGIVGVAPEVTFYAFKVLGASGSGLESGVLAALERVLDPDQNPATDDALQVINLSLGSDFGGPDDPESLALDYLSEAGVVCCVAAGNSGSYRSISSPGTSRRAITVGATDKLDSLAAFSSKGPVPGTYDMKPDLVAPGVNITSSWLGGGTASLSGTSMATPHVAGCAALLLQLHPSWTPDVVKSALSQSAHAIGHTPLERGSGRIDAVDAAAVHVAFEPTNLAFGRAPVSGSSWSRSRSLRIRNLTASPETVSFPSTLTVEAGATVTLSPPSATIAPGDSAEIEATLTLDLGALPRPEQSPFGYSATLTATCDSASCAIPVTFFRHAVLRVTSSQPLNFLFFVEDHVSRDILFGASSNLDEIPVSPGSYDITGFFDERYRSVTRTAVEVADSTSVQIDPDQATAVQSFEYLDPRGQPLVGNHSLVEFYRLGAKWGVFWDGFPFAPIRTSPGQPDLRLRWTCEQTDYASEWTSVSGGMDGVEGSEIHRNPPGPWKHFRVRIPNVSEPDPGLIFWHYFPDPQFPSGSWGAGSYNRKRAELPLETRIDWLDPPDQPMVIAFRFEIWPRDTAGRVSPERRPALISPYIRVDHGFPLETYMLGSYADPFVAFSGEEMRLFSGPPVWQGYFRNGSTNLHLDTGALSGLTHLTTDAYGSWRAEPDPTYEIVRDGATVASGTFQGAGAIEARGALDVPLPGPGTYEFRSHYDDPRFGFPAGLDIAARFSTETSNRNPPSLRALRIDAGGQSADTVDFGRYPDAQVRALVSGLSGGTLRLEVRGHGTTDWIPLEVGEDGYERVASLPADLFGLVDLRLTARDPYDNRLMLTWNPAYLSIVDGPPIVLGPDGRPRMLMEGAVPNPARAGETTIQFVLPDNAPAELDVMDLAGRRIFSRAVGPMGVGRHRIRLATGTGIRPGIYFARLRRGGQMSVRRICVIE